MMEFSRCGDGGLGRGRGISRGVEMSNFVIILWFILVFSRGFIKVCGGKWKWKWEIRF